MWTAYDFRHLDRLTYLLVIGFLLVSKVFIPTLFSSQILAVTIDDPFVVIDSFEDLNKRPELIPLLFAKEQNIPDFLVSWFIEKFASTLLHILLSFRLKSFQNKW